MSNPPAFNPLDKRNLGESVALALSRSQAVSLAELPSISGAGIYALYYSGDFPPVSGSREPQSAESDRAHLCRKGRPGGIEKGRQPSSK
jgi:hypothetical protein